MIKRILLAGSITLAAVGLGSATSAHATQYPPGCATVVTGAATVNPATNMTITASGYTSIGATITFYLIAVADDHTEGAIVVGTAPVNALGVASITIVTPTTLGSYDIIAVGGDCSDAQTSFSVGNIPRTGSDSQQWLVTASALLFTGLGFSLVAMRRRRTTVTA